jgi:phosphatidylglycerophosphate synthase
VILALDAAYRKAVYGIPVLKRTVVLLSRAGIEEVTVLTRDEPQEIQNLLKKVSPSVHLIPVGRPREDRELLSVLPSIPNEEPVLLVWGHTVLDAPTIEALYSLPHPVPTGISADLSDHCTEQALYLLPGYHVRTLVEQIINEVINPLSLLSAVPVYPAPGFFPFTVGRRYEDTVLVEYLLARQLKKETQASDGFMARHFDRLISLAMSRRLATTALTPNLITLCGVSIGLLGAWLLSYPYYSAQVLGAALFLSCVIVDGVDGEVARLKLKQSTFGHYLDIVTDNMVHVAVFIGIAVGLGARFGWQPYLWGLVILLVGFVLCTIAVQYCFRLSGQERLNPGSPAMKLLGLLANRDFAYLVFLLAVLDRLKWFFWGTAIGCILFAAALFVLARRASIPASK